MCAASEDAVMLRSILLLGATGNGKSTLGNYLIDPSEEHIDSGKGQTFTTAKSNYPQTKKVKSGRVRDNNFKHITIVDTPGLNDGDKKDLAHMIDLVKNLREIKTVTACAIVCKIDGKIDETFKMTIKYYSNLLPQIFENNVFIVLTKVIGGEKARRKMGIVLEEYMENVQDEVVELAELRFKPEVFTIDSLPLDDSTCEASLKTRSAILDYVSKMNFVDTSKLRIAKTAYIRQKDREMLESLKGRLTGYNDRLIEKQPDASEKLSSILHKALEKGYKAEKLTKCQEKLSIYDNKDLMTVKQWCLHEITRFEKKVYPFKVEAKCEISAVDKWDNGQLEWEDMHEVYPKGMVTGRIIANSFKRVHAILTVKAYRNCYNAEKIVELKKEEQRLLDEQKALTEEINSYSEPKYQEEIDDLKRKIEEIEDKSKAYIEDFMTISDADERLTKLLQCMHNNDSIW